MVECRGLCPLLELLCVLLRFGGDEGTDNLKLHSLDASLFRSLIVELFEVNEEAGPAKTGDITCVHSPWSPSQSLRHLLLVLSAIPNEYTVQSLHALILLHLLGKALRAAVVDLHGVSQPHE